jgi:hypothetical protein
MMLWPEKACWRTNSLALSFRMSVTQIKTFQTYLSVPAPQCLNRQSILNFFNERK